MKKLILCLALLISMSVTSVSAAGEPMTIVTSFYPMYAITNEIVGDLHEVQMINSGNGIHGFEPSVSDVAAIYDADIFIYHSKTLESWTKNLESNIGNHQVKMIQASEGMELRKIPGLEDIEVQGNKDQSNLYDPHSWLDPLEAGREAQLIAEALGQIDPENKETYLSNAQTFVDKANQLVEVYLPEFEVLKQRTFVTQHTAFYYLAERFGLTQLGVSGISSESEPSAKQLNEVMAFVNEYSVKTIFIEPNVSDRIATLISTSTGVNIETLSPLESDPQNNMTFLQNLETQLETLLTVLQNEE